MQGSFLTHARGLYFWLALVLVLVCTIVYAWHNASPVPNGGTMLGYSLGTLGSVMILWLLYLGRRKRNFSKGMGTVRGWVSAHVYLGCALLVVATLHTGFQFGLNIHTLAYLLMVLVIVSGLYGVWAYRSFPKLRNAMKKSATLDEIFVELEDVDHQLREMSRDADQEVRSVVTSAIERTEVGGGILDQLLGRDHSKLMIDGILKPNMDQRVLIEWLVKRLSEMRGQDTSLQSRIVQDCGARQKLLRTIRKDIRFYAQQEVWLLFHVPLSFALLAALIAHVVSVFIYW